MRVYTKNMSDCIKWAVNEIKDCNILVKEIRSVSRMMICSLNATLITNQDILSALEIIVSNAENVDEVLCAVGCGLHRRVSSDAPIGGDRGRASSSP